MRWHEIAVAWRSHSANAKHGEIGRLRERFASDRGIAPGTVRRATEALALAEALHRDYPMHSKETIEALPIDDLGVLGRLLRLGPNHLKEVLDAVVSRTIHGGRLARLEQDIRRGTSAAAGRSEDPHALRQWSESFRDLAVGVVTAAADGRPWAAVGRNDVLAPLSVDAVLREEDGSYSCFKFFAATTTKAERRRVNDAAAMATAAARAFDASWILAADQADAEALAMIIRSLGDCGVAVARISASDAARLPPYPARSAPPDLADAFNARICKFLGQ